MLGSSFASVSAEAFWMVWALERGMSQSGTKGALEGRGRQCYVATQSRVLTVLSSIA